MRHRHPSRKRRGATTPPSPVTRPATYPIAVEPVVNRGRRLAVLATSLLVGAVFAYAGLFVGVAGSYTLGQVLDNPIGDFFGNWTALIGLACIAFAVWLSTRIMRTIGRGHVRRVRRDGVALDGHVSDVTYSGGILAGFPVRIPGPLFADVEVTFVDVDDVPRSLVLRYHWPSSDDELTAREHERWSGMRLARAHVTVYRTPRGWYGTDLPVERLGANELW